MDAVVLNAKLIGDDPANSQCDVSIRAGSAEFYEFIVADGRKPRFERSAIDATANDRDRSEQARNNETGDHENLPLPAAPSGVNDSRWPIRCIELSAQLKRIGVPLPKGFVVLASSLRANSGTERV